MQDEQLTYARVHRIVRGDLAPVTPLMTPRARLLALLPVALALPFLAPATAFRHDLVVLGPVFGWGLSSLQWTAGFVLLGVALREAVPGYGVSRTVLVGALGMAIAVMLAVTIATYAVDPTPVPPGLAFRYWYECVIGPLLPATPILLVTVWLALRVQPTHPAAVGGLCGLAAGVLDEAGWRLACSVSEPTHVLLSHVFAVGLLAVIGAGLSTSVDRWRRRHQR